MTKDQAEEGLLWCVDHFIATLPKLQVWPLLRTTKKYFIVRLRDGERRFARQSIGRRFFTRSAEAVAHLRRCYAGELDRARKQFLRMRVLSKTSNELLLAFARGTDEAVDSIEREVSREGAT